MCKFGESVIKWFIFFLIILLSGCGNKMVRNEGALPYPELIMFECNGEQYTSDHEFIRSMGQGRSRNESTAHRMADLDASVNLAHAVENYLNSISSYRDNQQMRKEKPAYEGDNDLTDSADINMALSGIATVCSESTMDGDFFIVRKVVQIPLENILPD